MEKLELLLLLGGYHGARYSYYFSNPASSIRIIGMSATLEKLNEVGRWLDAKVSIINLITCYRDIEMKAFSNETGMREEREI